MNTAYPNDQRAHIRIPSSRPIVIILNHQSIYATMTDFSNHGIGILAAIAPQVHQQLEVHFELPEVDNAENKLHSFQFKAEVIHCIELPEENHIGVKLDLPTREYQSLFNKIAQQ